MMDAIVSVAGWIKICKAIYMICKKMMLLIYHLLEVNVLIFD